MVVWFVGADMVRWGIVGLRLCDDLGKPGGRAVGRYTIHYSKNFEFVFLIKLFLVKLR